MIIKFLISFVSILTQLLFWAVFISVLMSWFARGKSRLGEMLDRIVNPLLSPFRWARIGMLDFSPILLLILLDVVRSVAIQFLVRYISG